MFIDDLCGCNEYLDYAEYQEQIRQILCSGQDNEIHLSMRESTDGWNADYPCTLSILVKDQQAVVNYFSEDNEEMFASIGNLNREDNFRWQIGGNDYSVTGYQILSIERHCNVHQHFIIHRKNRPVLSGRNCKDDQCIYKQGKLSI